MYTLNLEVISHLLAMTLEMIHKDNKYHITINSRAKYRKKNKISPSYILNLEVILHYITLTGYHIVNET